MPDRITLTKSSIDAVRPPSFGRVFIYDTKIRGLALLVTATGAKSLYVYRKLHGRPKKKLICKWPDLTVEQIRKRAEEINVQISSGEDPNRAAREARQCKTMGELFAWYLENYAKPHKRESSWKFDEWQWNRFMTPWDGRLLIDVGQGELQALHAKIGRETGKIPANRLRSLLHTLFAQAKQNLGFAGDNPVTGVKRFDEQPRERYLGPDELPKLLAALDAEPNEMLADFFRLALFTGARRGNLQSAAWDEMDLLTGVWTIPADKAKSNKPLHIPLSAEAIDVLRRRQAATPGSPWVFPSRGKLGHLAEPKTAWKRICMAAGLKAVRLHDLRHTTASWMIARGASLYVVGKALGHASPQTTQRYAHLDLSDLRTALSGATGAMMAASGKPAKSKAKGGGRGKA